jgi:2,3-bisphosphoglycerate-dependent phosphoglycerate mutase
MASSRGPSQRSSQVTGTLILLRHGQSVGNAANGFTGWLDVPLTARGEAEAAAAGALVLAHHCAPAVVHSSVLLRAVHTARIVTDVVAGSVPRPPIRQSWRLNERHYGTLQGIGRDDVRARYGEEQFRRWRRGLRDAPPPLVGGGPDDPAGDPRYADVPAGLLPRGESLADVHARLLPYWTVIAADLAAGRTVLVVAHSNSLRALCMQLDDLDEREVAALDLPTGVPLRYDLDRCLRPRVRGGVFLDPDAARAGIAEVVAQGGSAGDGG